jgi:hypothetical protein
MRTFEDKVANDPKVDPRIRRRFAGLYAAGELGLRYKIIPPECDWFMDAIASCYLAAIGLNSNSSLSAAEAGVCLAKFIKDNQDQLLKVKGNGAITQRSYQKTIGLIPDPDRHGKQVWLKTKVVKKSVFPPGVAGSAVTKLVNNGVVSASQQQRVPGLKIKEYFYEIDSESYVPSIEAEATNKLSPLDVPTIGVRGSSSLHAVGFIFAGMADVGVNRVLGLPQSER